MGGNRFWVEDNSPEHPLPDFLSTDHGHLSGLADDDHVGYVLANGTRPITGDQTVDGDLTVTGAVNGAEIVSDGEPDEFLAADGTYKVPAGGTSDPLSLAQYLEIGASPAQSGAVRLAHGAQIVERNAAGNGDVAHASILTATKVLTDADIKALPTVHFEVVPSPGVGKMIVPRGGMVALSTVAQYVSPDSYPQIGLTWGDPGAFMASDYIGKDMLTDAVASQKILMSPIHCPQTLPDNEFGPRTTRFFNATTVTDRALVLRDDDNDGGSHYTGGDPANTLTVTVYYTVLDVS